MEERAYRILLAHQMSTMKDVAILLSIPLRKAQRLLDSVEAKGLATHSPEQPRRYIAAPPELAVQALATQRRADIERACSAIPDLKEEAVKHSGEQPKEQVVELITNRAALAQVLMHLHKTLQNEAIGFQRPPILYPHTPEFERAPSSFKPHVRTVSDSDYLELPGAWDSLRLVASMGEEIRVFPALPVKMFVADRRIGLIPLNSRDPNGPILLIRKCALLDALCSLFELIWEKATPVVFNQEGQHEITKPISQLSDSTKDLLPLLAAGLNDKAIAYEAGVSGATLTRRVTELMKRFDSRTRFQLGWRAALEASHDGTLARSNRGTQITR